MLFQDRRDGLEIPVRRRDHTARAHDRLGKETGDGLGTLGGDGVLKLFGQTRGELGLGFAGLTFAPIMRAGQVDKPVQGQAKHAVIGFAGH